VDCAVECAVAALVEPVPHGAPAAGRQRAGAGQRGECGLVAAPSGVGEAHDGLGGADRSDAGPVGQAWGEIVDDGLQLSAVGPEDAPGFAHGQGDPSDLGLRTTCSRLASRGPRRRASPGEDGVGERAAGELS
jgi:hypothetical protein